MSDPTTDNDPGATRQIRHPLPGAPPAPGVAHDPPRPATAARTRLTAAVVVGMVLAVAAAGVGTAALDDGPSSPPSVAAAASDIRSGEVVATKADIDAGDEATMSTAAVDGPETMAAASSGVDPVDGADTGADETAEVTPTGTRPAPPARPGPGPAGPARPRT